MSEPWLTESDADAWNDPETGYRCVMQRHPQLLNWCGYVAAPAALAGLDYDAKLKVDSAAVEHLRVSVDEIGVFSLFAAMVEDGAAEREAGIWPLNLLARCHGGVTYAGEAFWAAERGGWWFGFDCGHAGDLAPGMIKGASADYRRLILDTSVYRTAEFVRQTCGQLAEDLRWLAENAARVAENPA